MASFLPVIHSHWHHSFDGLQFSSMDFFKSVEESISRRQIPELSFKRIALHEKGLFSAKREYLRISRNEYAYDISAAPFGTGFFVSYWFGEKLGFWKKLILSIPLIGFLYARSLKKKTYFQHDTENMFKGGVHSSVMETIEGITTTKGIRALSELDKRPIDNKR